MTSMPDRFVHDRLPPRDAWPVMDYAAPGSPSAVAAYPARLNCAVELLDRMVESGHADRPVLRSGDTVWSYAALLARVDRIARVLVEQLGLVPGNRVLLRAPNTPMMAACWLAVVKAGGVAVATMPLLRAGELAFILEKAQVGFALCDAGLTEALDRARAETGRAPSMLTFTALGEGGGTLDAAAAAVAAGFEAFDSAADDPALIAFTSGTTGRAKGTVHFHRDVLAICDTFAQTICGHGPDEIFIGSPPLAFTFGLGALVLFPMRAGASTVMAEKPGPDALLELIARHRVTTLYTAPTAYRAMLAKLEGHDVSSLRLCVSAGEHLPRATWEAWFEATGIRIVDGIGATEMLHIFISAAGDDIRPGATGRAVPGYEARIVDDEGRALPPGEQGWLAVRGPTGCRYLDDPERQAAYVRDGWNITGDVFRADADGYFWYVARGDDMIVSSGYNIAGPEVENCLMAHEAVAECAVVGVPDPDRGQIVKAFVVLREGVAAGDETAELLQEHVKAAIAPYKYPRAVTFVTDLPRTQTGKLQRFRLREGA